MNTVQIPQLRAAGFALLAIVVAIHNSVLTPERMTMAVVFACAAAAYSLLSWQLLRRYYSPVIQPDLGLFFLTIDVFIFLVAIHATGGQHSWLFLILMIRVADQIPFTYWRAVYFTHLTVGAYVFLLVWIQRADHQPVAWGPEMSKIVLLYLGNWFLALTAKTSEDVRNKMRDAMHLSSRLVKKLEEKGKQLEESRMRAEEASRAKSEFLATMSHEIRTPLNVLLGMTDLLRDTPLSPQQKEYLATVRSAGENLLGVISDVLDLAKIESRRMEIERAVFPLPALASDVVSLLRPQTARRPISLNCTVDPACPEYAWGDAMRIRQVLANLVSNAIKFTEEGVIEIRLIAHESSATTSILLFEVEDSGIGISEESLQRLFQPFRQADASTTRRFGGTGLGLAICKQLVEMMGGQIGVRSEPGAGSLFWFRLELERAAKPAAAAADNTPLHASQEGIRILIADDNPLNRLLASRQVEKLGYQAITVTTGAEAVAAVRQSHFDAILMDCQMPELDGFAATEAIRRLDSAIREIPIIALTANAFSEDKERCFEAGMNDYLPKPVDFQELARVLSKWTVCAPIKS